MKPVLQVVLYNACHGLKIGMDLEIGLEPVLENKIRLLEACLRIAAYGYSVGGYVAVNVMDCHGICIHGWFRMKIAGQGLILNADQGKGLHGRLRIDGRNGRHLIAHETHTVFCQYILILDLGVISTKENPRRIIISDNGPNTRQSLRSGGVHIQNPCMGKGASQDLSE
jgi:hypothetical protein